MEINFKGKTALVTGAGRGIGRETVKKLLSAGADVIAVSKTAANLTSLVEEVSFMAGEFVLVNLLSSTCVTKVYIQFISIQL